MASTGRYSPNVRERTVRMVLEREDSLRWATIVSIAAKTGVVRRRHYAKRVR